MTTLVGIINYIISGIMGEVSRFVDDTRRDDRNNRCMRGGNLCVIPRKQSSCVL